MASLPQPVVASAPPPPPPPVVASAPPPPLPLVFLSEPPPLLLGQSSSVAMTSFAELVQFNNIRVDEEGFLEITLFQLRLFHATDIHNTPMRDMRCSFLEFTNVVYGCLRGSDDYLKALATSVVPKLQSLAFPDCRMPLRRYHSERAVKMLGKEINIEDGDFTATGMLVSVTFTSSHRGTCYMIRFEKDSVPLEREVDAARLHDGTAHLREVEAARLHDDTSPLEEVKGYVMP